MIGYFEVDVPFCGFRPYTAREFQETYQVPPPATVAGMLLSFLGIEREDAQRYEGTGLAIAVRPPGIPSTVVRKMTRISRNHKSTSTERPEYQQFFMNYRLWVGIDDSKAVHSLLQDLKDGLREPEKIRRYGAVSLGESLFTVDSIREVQRPVESLVLRPDARGTCSLPLWVDYFDRTKTRHGVFNIVPGTVHEGDFMHVFPTA